MNALVAAKAGTIDLAPAGFTDRLKWLCKFGKPRVGVSGSGWYAKIEMNTNTTGTSFDVSSDFGMADPEKAVAQLIERMLAALAALGATP